jgi:hypothetical protein
LLSSLIAEAPETIHHRDTEITKGKLAVIASEAKQSPSDEAHARGIASLLRSSR